MSVSIKVAVRCRPFTQTSRLGVQMVQNGEEEGEVVLLNQTRYTTSRFPFTHAWWSAHNWRKYVDPQDSGVCGSMVFTTQEMVYESCGQKIKADLLAGSAVVLFAYGLSGSGKTYTVFGPDAADSPEAWFKHRTPHEQWGLYPRLAYELFQMKQDGWKFSMKYFQNVVDTVRDLMSRSAIPPERSYKDGMRRDPDGFMDIDWTEARVLNSWNDLCAEFQEANKNKAISPTQFNHQSTRGHCIMVLEIEMPHPDMEGMKQRPRVYVCDLAGTEPAGDIYYAKYEKKTYDNGDIEYKLVGPHEDQSKTKLLQDQGKKINLSLTEMGQFFQKMADAVKAKKLKPGMSIPGCNSYFLCKYLKDTMLQAKTYLFCACRPEVEFHSYTFATMGFAQNASVVKLQPKKAGAVAATLAERKLMMELEEMKSLVTRLTAQNEQLSAGGGDTVSGDMAALQQMLQAKQAELANVLQGSEISASMPSQDILMQQQREEYGRRGISLSYFEKDTPHPHLFNVDEENFRSKRFMYILVNSCTTIGSKNDIQPLSLSVVANHCELRVAENGDVRFVGGKGESYVNGIRIAEGESTKLNSFDRVAIGGELFMFRYPGRDQENQEEPTAEFAVQEYQAALRAKDEGHQQKLEEQLRQFQLEKEQWEKARISMGETMLKEQMDKQAQREAYEAAMHAVDKEILDLLPKTKESKRIVDLLNRSYLEFEVLLCKAKDDGMAIPKVKVKVHNTLSDESIFIDPFEFMHGLAILKDELMKLRNALENDRDYCLPERHDPLFLLFDITFHLGTVTLFNEYLCYLLETEEDESRQQIKNATVPYNNIGILDVSWSSAGSASSFGDTSDVEDPRDLIGRSWAYKLHIKHATALPVITDMAYCQYEFFGETFVTETVEQDTCNPVWNYEFVHSVEHVTEEFIEFLSSPFEIQIFISPYVAKAKDALGTSNEFVRCNLGQAPLPNAPPTRSLTGVAINMGTMDTSLSHDLQDRVHILEDENQSLKNKIEQLQTELAALRETPLPRQKLASAIAQDQALNIVN